MSHNAKVDTSMSVIAVDCGNLEKSFRHSGLSENIVFDYFHAAIKHLCGIFISRIFLIDVVYKSQKTM
jgi:hypothetical protein